MKTLAIILLLSGLALGQSEILRPTADVNTGASSWVQTNCGIGTYIADSTSGVLAYDASGQATAMAFGLSNKIATVRTTARTFLTWANTANSYSALTLNVNAKRTDSAGGAIKIVYTTNAGSTWTSLGTPTSSQTTFSVALNAGQDLTQLRVGVCLEAEGFDPGTQTTSVNLYDIWTSGSLTSASAVGNGSSSGTAALGAITSQ